MKKSVLAFLFAIIFGHVFSQVKNDLLIGVQADLIKTNTAGYFKRFQVGAEGNFFFSEKFTITGGVEYWTQVRQFSLVAGGRWYPTSDAFLRVRGLLGANDFSLGGGWSRPVTNDFRFEALSDFYFAGHITIRAGFTYTFRKK
jgi:hypothetical protein